MSKYLRSVYSQLNNEILAKTTSSCKFNKRFARPLHPWTFNCKICINCEGYKVRDSERMCRWLIAGGYAKWGWELAKEANFLWYPDGKLNNTLDYKRYLDLGIWTTEIALMSVYLHRVNSFSIDLWARSENKGNSKI